MRIHFHGAAGDVTGSAYHVVTDKASVLVDCGFFQGRKEESAKNRRKAQLEGGKVDAVLLTHGHLDHIGRLPLLTRNGYKGPIYATRPTLDIATLILKDSLALQKQDLKRENQKRARARLPPLEPLFEEADVRKLKPLATPVKYNQRFSVAPGIEARLVDAGHVIGSASVELTVSENGHKKTVVFSGDLGPRGAPLLNDPEPFKEADAVIMESTYGDRNHRSMHDTAIEGREIIAKAIDNKAKVLVPVFAVGRTQLLLYLMAGAFKRKTLPRFPIFLDSPMAIQATKIYGRNSELFDEEALAMVQSGELLRSLNCARPCSTPGESRALNNEKGPCMIMAGSGMCTGGRIMHHLRHNLPVPETAVLIVGFQSPGTLGRKLVDGAKSVMMFGEEVPVRASIHTMGGFSAHADQQGLLDWFSTIAPSRPRTIITHGEDRARQVFGDLINSRFGLQTERPVLGDVIEI
ncbi:MAG TPA: MBL fold metallo-hydrolase [Pyrinomonadaceae bacterium]|nr:MBL fold metallo-hydrolase [Pyrinomonadaceae bacterium]